MTLVGDQNLRILLEIGRDDDRRDVVANIVDRQEQVAGHQEIDLSGRQQRSIVHLRTAHLDLDVQPVLGVGSVSHCLVETAVTALGKPVGRKDNLVGCRGATRDQHCRHHGE